MCAASSSSSSKPSRAAYEDAVALYERMRADTDPYISAKVRLLTYVAWSGDAWLVIGSFITFPFPSITHTQHYYTYIHNQVAAALDVVEQAVRLYGPEKVFASYNGGKVRQSVSHGRS